MKKLMVILGMLALIGTAHAQNYWNLMWQIEGAFAPETDLQSMVPVLQDYSIVWSLMSTSSDTPIYSMEQAAVGQGGSTTFGFGDFNEYLACTGSSRFKVETNMTGTYDLYQRIEASNGVDTYEWTSAVTEQVKPTDDTSIPPTQLLGSDAIVVGTAWTKISPQAVPEPATMSLLGLGALAMVLRRKVRK